MHQKHEMTLELLALAATALRDLHQGYPEDELAGHSGKGLAHLLPDIVTHLREHGINDEGGWDCDLTDGIPVVKAADVSAGENLEGLPYRNFEIGVTRIGYGHRTLTVSARTAKEAIGVADEQAGSYEFSEKVSDYEFEVRSVESLPLNDRLTALGLEIASTGGGSAAWMLTSSGWSIMLTDLGGLSADIADGDALLLGYYDDSNGTPVEEAEGPWETILPKIQAFVAGNWKRPAPDASV